MSSPQATLRKSSPTAIWTPRMTARGKIRATRSSSPLDPSSRNVAPMISEPAAISSTPSPSAIAMAPNAFSGCTGIGKR